MDKRRSDIAATVILGAVAALMITSLLAGYHFYTVRSGSMSPGLHVGDMVIATPVQSSEIKVNDVVAYRSPDSNSMVCHRVIEINQTGGYIITKGDANEGPDPYHVPYSSVAEREAFSIPYLGFVASFIISINGLITIGGLALAAYGIKVMLKEQDGTMESGGR